MKDIDKINKILDNYPKDQSPLIPILHEIEDLYNFLPVDVLNYISEKLDISLEYIYSVATFYNSFKLYEKGKYEISVCLGTVCYVKGSENILKEITKILNIKNGEITEDKKFSLDTTRCLGCCSMAPVLKINDDIYGSVKIEDVKSILEKYE